MNGFIITVRQYDRRPSEWIQHSVKRWIPDVYVDDGMFGDTMLKTIVEQMDYALLHGFGFVALDREWTGHPADAHSVNEEIE